MTNTRGKMVLWRALAGAAVVLMALLGGSGAALAHDAVEGTAPADGSSVATVPEKVTVTLSNTPASIGSQINVVDASGTNWSAGTVEVLDNVATQQLKPGAPAGKYTVQWRLVSSDGHPIEGQFVFTAAAAAGAGSGAVAGPLQSVQEVSPAATAKTPDSGGVPWSVFGLVGVLVVVVVAMVVVAKRRLGADD
ncbi:copper resistance CopC family protein [Arthrobacter sp. GMC3]|uniref:copper resistance CopC family protein n=1 Tax=Arthrobacter sp. GMC3 TaxID=2058894 RepID=UPI00215853F2|nr:copper resistance CopC family protein [Arthrobacter sp. GMC3]